MDKPYKVVWKYKNLNRCIQHHVYIFVGKLRTDLYPIFDKIADWDLYKTLTSLEKSETKQLNDAYGEYWYKFFFVSRNIEYSLKNIQGKKSRREALIKIYGTKWYEQHIVGTGMSDDDDWEEVRVAGRKSKRELQELEQMDENMYLVGGGNSSMSQQIGGDASEPVSDDEGDEIDYGSDDDGGVLSLIHI